MKWIAVLAIILLVLSLSSGCAIKLPNFGDVKTGSVSNSLAVLQTVDYSYNPPAPVVTGNATNVTATPTPTAIPTPSSAYDFVFV